MVKQGDGMSVRGWRNGAAATVAGAGLAVALTACSLMTPVSKACASWERFSSAQDMYDAASLVVVGAVDSEGISRTIQNVQTRVHDVAVSEVLKGELPADRQLTVAMQPDACAGRDQSADPLDTANDSLLFLLPDASSSVWLTLNPSQGVLPAGDRGELQIPGPNNE